MLNKTWTPYIGTLFSYCIDLYTCRVYSVYVSKEEFRILPSPYINNYLHIINFKICVFTLGHVNFIRKQHLTLYLNQCCIPSFHFYNLIPARVFKHGNKSSEAEVQRPLTPRTHSLAWSTCYSLNAAQVRDFNNSVKPSGMVPCDGEWLEAFSRSTVNRATIKYFLTNLPSNEVYFLSIDLIAIHNTRLF